jgi:hypothetical protein
MPFHPKGFTAKETPHFGYDSEFLFFYCPVPNIPEIEGSFKSFSKNYFPFSKFFRWRIFILAPNEKI